MSDLRQRFGQPTLDVARGLIGLRLVRQADDEAAPRVGRIVEVEAYIGEEDLASHARFGRTGRNAVMYGPPGIGYVYLVYGMYDCLNIVTEPPGRPAAVLVRAVEPFEGADAIRAARVGWWRRRHPSAVPERLEAEAKRLRQTADWALARGPGLVAAGFSIDRSMTGLDLLDRASPLRVEAAASDDRAPDVLATPRIGIAYAGSPWTEMPWRFVDGTSPSLSGPRHAARS
ncbi:MAG: DNA-3-methyladenine glycosylase [Chloroflexota bacterium]